MFELLTLFGIGALFIALLLKRIGVLKKWIPQKTHWFVDLILPLVLALIFALVLSYL